MEVSQPRAVYIRTHEKQISQTSTLFSETSVATTLCDVDTFTPDLEKQSLQSKPKPYTLLRYTLLNTYRRLFSLVFIGNAIAFIIVMVKGVQILGLVNAAAINLAVCGLARQPLVVNAIFKYISMVPRSAPLRLRLMASKLFHYGGVHSGAGVASAIWYIAFVGMLTYHYTPSPTYIATTVLAYLILVLVIAIIVSAYPAIRFRMHDYFEFTHRFSGWAVIILFWALLLTYASQQAPSMGGFLVRQPAFWVIIILTIAVLQPWIMLRKVPVTSEVLSTHAIRLHFTHTKVDFGQGLSLSRHPLRDFHSFASFPDKFDSPESSFSLVVSKAGDWTGDVIKNPPTKLWKRGVPAYGFGYVMKMFHSMVLVTTGSGIGPCLSYLGLENRPLMKILWQTRSPLKTYGQGVMNLVHRLDPKPVVLDTSKDGRVDMLPFVINLYREFNAEAVCVISNPKLTKDLVYGLESRGIPAMGPIFDS